MGREVRGISENTLATFERHGVIQKIVGDLVIWAPEGMIMTWTSHSSDVELLPPLKAKVKGKTGKSSFADIKEIRVRFPELHALSPGEALTDIHLGLGSWIVWRDICRGQLPPKEHPHLFCSRVAHAFSSPAGSVEELQQEQLAGDILKGRWRLHGLLGFPIADAGHWTLLVLRRSGQVVQIRYYDSVEFLQEKCLERAQKIAKFLLPNQEFPGRRNRTFQGDGISCGLFVLHYWEAEVRQFSGEGWSLGRPKEQIIKKIRLRVTNLAKEVLDAPVELEPPKKKKKVPEEDLAASGDLLEAAPAVPAAVEMVEHLQKVAKQAVSCGSVEFYGCSKCRWSRGGCISWRCNPEKFKKHFEKFPEKYINSKELKAASEKKISAKELVGEIP